MSNLLSGLLSQQKGDASAARSYYARYLAREPNGSYAEELVSVLDQLPDEPYAFLFVEHDLPEGRASSAGSRHVFLFGRRVVSFRRAERV